MMDVSLSFPRLERIRSSYARERAREIQPPLRRFELIVIDSYLGLT